MIALCAHDMFIQSMYCCFFKSLHLSSCLFSLHRIQFAFKLFSFIRYRQHQLNCLKSGIIDFNYRQITTTPPTTTTNTSSSSSTCATVTASVAMITKQAPHFNQLQSTRYEGDTLMNLVSFSNTEPQLIGDQIVHDINCAKNKNSSYSKATNATSNI